MTTAAQVDQIIGKRARLALAHASACVYVPVTPKPSSPLAVMVGLGNALRLAQVFGGETLQLRKEAGEKIARRNEQIKEAAKLGATQRELAKRHDLTVRHIRRILGD
jgi:Mor transcription activator family